MPKRPWIPAGFRRVALPAYNAGVHAAWRLGEYLGAARHGRFGRCEVCGRYGPWLYRRRVVAPALERLWGLTPRLAEALARKESSDCAWCGAKLRSRRLARVLLDLYPAGPANLADWARTDLARGLRIAEVNVIEGLHEALLPLPSLAASDFDPAATTTPGGLKSEDLCRLSYPDAAFDLVLTSESLEHVPDLDAALGEIRRVLRPGGRHVFTVPVLPGTPTTSTRTLIRPDGTLDHRATPISHPGGDWGYPVFTEFGLDLPGLLERAGFRTRLMFGPVSEDDLAQVYVCERAD